MYAEERQMAIVAQARDEGRVSVSKLAIKFDVTPETIRRDLEVLAGLGVVSRVHGGAVPAENLRLGEAALGEREDRATPQKRAIAEAAVGLIPLREGVTVLLDAGTTTARLAERLNPTHTRTIVTNSVPIASSLALREGFDVQLLGGQVRGITQATVGTHVADQLSRLRVDVAFMGANGFSVDHGFSTPDPAEAAVKQAMVRIARLVVMLADSSKWGVDYLISFAGLTNVDILVTDSGLPEAARQQLIDNGTGVLIA